MINRRTRLMLHRLTRVDTFPIADVTNYHNFCGLKAHGFIYLTFLEVRSSKRVSLDQNEGVGRAGCLRRLQGEPLPCLTQLWEAAHSP